MNMKINFLEENRMKKIAYKILSAFLSAVTLVSTTCFSVSAETNIQPRGSWYLYGDVNNDGHINLADDIYLNSAYGKYEQLTGDSKLPVSYAVARPSVYFEKVETPVPQAADINGDGYISQEDSEMLLRYLIRVDNTGRCGQHFYI